MTVFTTERLRAAIEATGLAPWATAGHAADLMRVLRLMPAAPGMTVIARSSTGAAWSVTRAGYAEWRCVGADGRGTAGSVEFVVEYMEAQP